jgi:UDP-N-acetylglucosamine 1-carboxyvinyltransferase
MGATVRVRDGVAVVEGPARLRGAEVVAHDLRAGVALVLAGLAAEGETLIDGGEMIERGHSHIAGRLAALGADVVREG